MIRNVEECTFDLVRLLVAEKYEDIERLTNHVRLSAADIKKAVQDYGRTLVVPPTGVDGLIDVIDVINSNPRQWSVRVDLWTKEEGRSDLSMEATVIQTPEGFRIELDDIHVL